MPASFLFYDLETFGADPRKTRIAQFAAIRTDLDLNPIEDPVSFFVKPADDLLPSPTATLITGIAPQRAMREGANEAEAFSRILEEMSQPETCSVGYNSLRFDDEFIRYGLYRNFYDAYEREWRGGNSRWDLLDVMRLAHALRPEGIVWPTREDGYASFRLEHLASANDVRDGAAHEALSDVRALIGMAKKLKRSQPRLWEYALRLRDKRYAAQLLDTTAMTPLLHVSQRYSAARLCAAAVVPLTRHPVIDSRVIVYDLDSEPDALLRLDPDGIAERLYIRQADLPEGESRIPLKEVHLNRCPALIEWAHLRDSDFERLNIDIHAIDRRLQQLRAVGPALAEKVRQVFSRRTSREPVDADAALYHGFITGGDRDRFSQVRSTPPELLAQSDFVFRDARLVELLFRYRARNWPLSLGFAEHERWNEYRRQRLTEDKGWSELTFEQLDQELRQLRALHAQDATKLGLLDRVEAWAKKIEMDLS